MKNSLDYEGIRIKWLNHHAAFMIETREGKRVYIDPWELKENDKADIILVTHSHFDHYNAPDIARIKTNHTLVLAPPECKSDIGGNFRAVHPGTKIAENGIIIEAVPAYNTNKFKSPGQPFHPREKSNVGFIVNINGIYIYHAGDTDFINEMRQLHDIDIALVPCAGTYTMTSAEAAQACNAFMPKIAVPMHWGKIVGSRKDAEDFAHKFQGKTIILE